MSTLMEDLGVDSSPEARGVTDGYAYGQRVAGQYWLSAPVLHAMGDPLDRTSPAEEQLTQAREVLGVEVSDEEARGFTDRWNELQVAEERDL